MCGGGAFGQNIVSFWISEFKNQQWINTNKNTVFNQFNSIRGVREFYIDPTTGKVTLICVPGQTDREMLRTSFVKLGYSVIR
ncbi:hypothetical protein L1765_08320 [Microaerobacter geothermalis]|uniref:hypothetical protein n=1 Tax=Microaerobacter geothermalis TaxID=674972 RepID=UPI001F3830CC|nr:hypothetical protein [Microaerobacter geothermalis]MCF6093974.1 hypothetical protein [Microaerobacter geothermalis]